MLRAAVRNSPPPVLELWPGLNAGMDAAPSQDALERAKLIMKLRRKGIRNVNVLAAMEHTPREKFIAKRFADKAYDDVALPIESGQTISQPSIVATMTMMLEPDKRTCVLEVGTGSGYQTAIVARLARRVYTIERHADLLRTAEARFAQMELNNITARHGDGCKGWPQGAPFDRIIVTAAAEEIPLPLLEQLAPGGLMLIPVGPQGADQQLLRIHKNEQGKVRSQALMPVRFVPLVSE